MSPGELFKKWRSRLENTDEEAIAHKLINEFLIDIEGLHIEPTEEEIEARELISKIVEQMRKDGVKINLD